MKSTLTRLLWTLALVAAIPGQAEEPLPPTFIAPELEKLSGLVGIWEISSKYRFTPASEIYESKSVATITWSPNRQYLITDERGRMPDGWKNQLVITSWNSIKREYGLVVLSPDRDIIQPTMTIEGNVRTILYYAPLNGRLIRTELKQEDISPTEIKFRCECTDEGKTWVFYEGSSRKRPQKTSNHAMQPTTGGRTPEFSKTSTSHPAATRALASGG